MKMYKTYWIYQIKNKITERIYIGKSCLKNISSIEKRYLRAIKSTSNRPIVSDMRELGISEFKFSIVEELNDVTQKEAIDTEAKYIKEKKSLIIEGGYNVLKSQEDSRGFLGRKHTNETKKKMRESHKNRPPQSEETRRLRSETMTGIPKPEYLKKIWSESQKGVRLTDETKRKISEKMKNRKLSSETKKKMSVAAFKRKKRNKENK